MQKIAALIALFVLSLPLAAETFRVEQIRVDGLQRISEGTVFSFLPLDVGDELTPAIARSAIRDLFRSGFFDDIKLSRDGNILIIEVEERPAISSIVITGNRQIKTEDLMPALAGVGIAEGEVFNRLDIDRVQQELTREYYSRGHFGASVDTRITTLERNRVDLSFIVEEGKISRIRHVNIVGNEQFKEKELRKEFESSDRMGLAFWRGRTKYTREKISGDLERLRAFYLDRGYMEFAIESTQVSISPDKQSMYITANIREGDVYTVSDVQVTGELILPEPAIRNLLMINAGETFSRRLVEQSVDNISMVLANIGYAFANVNPIPLLDRDTREVELNFFIEPGKRVFVRRIEFRGNTKTQDEVLRREMRQLEGAWFSQAAVDRSRLRLQRLGFFEEVSIETPAVEGVEDQIDVIVNVTERPSGSFQIGFGFSQIQGLIASISVRQENFMGTGRQVGFSVARSRIFSQISINYNNPFWRDDGISRGFFLRYSKFDQGRANISAFSTSVLAGGMNIGFPVSELDFMRFGTSAQRLDINIGDLIILPIDPEDPNAGFMTRLVATRPLAISLDEDGDGFLSGSERRATTFRLDGTWTRDSRNHFLNPTRGSLNRFTAEVAVPGSTREFYKLTYRFRKYWPITRRIAFSIRGDLAHGDTYDDFDDKLPHEEIEPVRIFGDCQLDEIVTLDDGLPFYEHFFGGGVQDIRGFDDNTLGPKDQFCRSVGGDFKASGGFEIAFPMPIAQMAGSRLAWFVDVGNVYRNYREFDAELLRASTGVSLTWEAPIGPVVINLSHPIRKRDGDDTQFLQFSFGTVF